ncbi:MAG: hypothetical protein ACI4P5_07560, partial [Candidatus Fimadaptatus sp.]
RSREIAIPLALLGRRRLPSGSANKHQRRKNAAAKSAKQQPDAEQHTTCPLRQGRYASLHAAYARKG